MKNWLRALIVFPILFDSAQLWAQTHVFAQLTGAPVNTTGWTFQGAATVGNITGTGNSEVIVCPNQFWQTGAVFYNQPINLSLCNKWIAEFDYRIYDGSLADGLAFCFLDVPPTGFVVGGGMGIPATANGLKICFDQNPNCFPLNFGDYPKIEIRWGAGYDECWAQPTADNSTGALSFIRSPNYNHVKIVYNNGNISVYVNNTLYVTGFQTFNFSGYMGFTSATGAKDDNHSVKNVVIYTDMPASEAGANVTVCSGTAVQLGTTPDPANVYTWQVSPVAGAPAVTAPGSIADPLVTLSNPTAQSISYKYLVGTAFATAPGCSSVDSVIVTVLPKVAINPSIQVINQCTGSSYTLPSGKIVNATGLVLDTLKNKLGCDSIVNSYQVTEMGITEHDTTVCKGSSFALHGRDALTWQWAPSHGLSNTTVQNPVLLADSNLTYSLTSTFLARNLVVNGDFEAGNTGFFSSYIYCNTGNCLYPLANDGYSVGTNANYYHTLFTGHDHTTGSGNFMIVNGADPTRTVWRETIPINANTTYAFGCWISTMIGLSPAQIRFSINGTQLGPIYQAATALNTWNQFFITWNSGSSTTATIEIVDVLNQSNGNDFGLDDIFFGQVTSCTDNVKIGLFASAAAHLSGPSANICTGAPASFTVAATGTGSGVGYQWVLNGKNVGTNAPTYSYTSAAQGDKVYCVVTDPDACAGSQVIHSDTIAVPVYPTVTPTVSISTTTNVVCAGTEMTFSALATNEGGGSIQWLVNGVPAGSGNSFIVQAPGDGDVVSCVLASGLPCTAPVASNVVKVQVLPAVVSAVQIAASANGVCSDSSVVFTATPVNGGDKPTYQWLLNGKATGGGSGPIFSAYNLANGDVVNCMLTSSISCTSPVSAASPITMVVYPSPQILAMPKDQIIAAGSTVVLTPVISGTGLSYSWSPAEGLSDAHVAAPVASPDSTTLYTLTVSTIEGCLATGKVSIGVFKNLAMPNAFSPNGDGRNDVFRIPPEIPLAISGFQIYNRQGALLFSTQDGRKGWDGRYGGRLQAAGTYIWVIEYVNPLTKSAVMQRGTVELVR